MTRTWTRSRTRVCIQKCRCPPSRPQQPPHLASWLATLPSKSASVLVVVCPLPHRSSDERPRPLGGKTRTARWHQHPQSQQLLPLPSPLMMCETAPPLPTLRHADQLSNFLERPRIVKRENGSALDSHYTWPPMRCDAARAGCCQAVRLPHACTCMLHFAAEKRERKREMQE
jgi:hypothetical protein